MCAFSGPAISASCKVRYRRSTLMTGGDYARLLEEETVRGIARLLSKTSYASILKDVNLEAVRRSELESHLSFAIFQEAESFRPYLSASSRKLLELWFESFDIVLFKLRFRSRFGGGMTGGFEEKEEGLDEAEILNLLSEYRLTLVDQKKLFAAQTPREFVEAVNNERLRQSLLEALLQNGEEERFPSGETFQKLSFAFGTILDQQYYNALFVAGGHLPGAEGSLVQRLIGTRVDLLNLYWIYRGRRFFCMSPEQALTLVTRVRYRLNFDFLSRVAFAPLESWPELLAQTPYAVVFGAKDSGELREIEMVRNLCRVLAQTASTLFMSGTMGFHHVVSYLNLKEFEVRDLIAVIEAVRYGFNREKIGSLLIQPLGGEASYGMEEV
ncbi:MAG: V-type ATPase subunit [Fretibacterium sp.]|nr:V-type ATPase subunit [Fretibacterium sp.]